MTMIYKEINFTAYKYITSIHHDIKEICKPLSLLGIQHFIYFKAFNDGSYFIVTNDKIDFIEFFLLSIKKQGDFLTNKLNNMHVQPYFMLSGDINLFNKKVDPVVHLLHELDIWNLFAMSPKTVTGTLDIYGFATSRTKILPFDFYYSKMHLLEHFINYFNEKAKDLIDTSDTKRLAYLKQSFSFYSQTSEEKETEIIKNFLKETMLPRININSKGNNIILTPREKECLEYLALGYTAKGIANMLDLSSRTVEGYLHNIKQKTGCSSKSKLLTEFITYPSSTFIKTLTSQYK